MFRQPEHAGWRKFRSDVGSVEVERRAKPSGVAEHVVAAADFPFKVVGEVLAGFDEA
jgi:hypothetical protein